MKEKNIKIFKGYYTVAQRYEYYCLFQHEKVIFICSSCYVMFFLLYGQKSEQANRGHINPGEKRTRLSFRLLFLFRLRILFFAKQAKNSSWNMTWYNQPFNSSVSTKISQNSCRGFPASPYPTQNVQQNYIKMSYSSMSNVSGIITAHDKSLLSNETYLPTTATCKQPKATIMSTHRSPGMRTVLI